MPVTMLAPNNTGSYSVISGAQYKPDQFGLITNVPIGTDVRDLVADGCVVLGLGIVGRNNMASIVDPTANNDASQDFAVGSVWVNTAAGKIFTCVANTAGAAVWANASGGGIASGSSATLNNLTLTGLLFESAGAGVTASTTRTQAGATVLTKEVTRVDVSTAPAAGTALGDGVLLQAATPGLDLCVINNTANIITVYPNGTDQINGLGAGVGMPIPPGDVAQFECAAAGDFRAEAGVGSFKQFELLLTVVGITAGTTRTQAGATLLVGEFNKIDFSTPPATGTVLGDGILLPPAVSGIDLEVTNNTLNIITIYGSGADTINGVAGATGVPLAPGAVETFFAMGSGAWFFDAGIGSSGAFDTVIACDVITAAGTTQATAGNLPAVINRVTAGAGGVRLPPSAAGLDILIINHTGGPIQVYGSGTDQVDDTAGATGIAQMNGSLCLFACATPGNWYSNGVGTGYAGAYPTVSYTNGVTAAVGGGQAAAVLITTALARVTGVATPGDSVKLPLAVGGMSITILNAHIANSMNVFPNTGDAINALAANVGYALPAGKTVTFFSTVGGFWHALLSA